jgi:SAM-dependent methyltransferase
LSVKKKLLSRRFEHEPSPHLPHAIQSEATETVRRKLAQGEYGLRNYDCPCGTPPNDVIISEVERYGLPLNAVVCLACGTIRLNPYLDNQALEDFYTRFYQLMYRRAPDVAAYVERQGAYGKKILAVTRSLLPSRGWVFEVGCGAGGALQVFANAGYRVAGCDYSAELIAEARRVGIEHAFHSTLDSLDQDLPDVKLDLIYLHHVFEHLTDPLEFLVTCRRYLQPGGSVVVIVPDVSRIHSFSNPDGDLMAFLHIAHKHNFSLEGLNRLCVRARYVLEELAPDPSIRTVNSDMPELWIQMRLAENGEPRTVDVNAGDTMLRYLAETESDYLWRRHRRRLTQGIARLSPLKIISKLRRTQ